MRSTIIKISAVILLGVFTIVVFYAISIEEISNKNGFERRFTTLNLRRIAVSKRPPQIRDISGLTQSSIYFQTNKPSELLIADHFLLNWKHSELKIPNDDRVSSLFKSLVDSPHIYIMAGNKPRIMIGDLKSNIFRNEFNDSMYFTRAVPINNYLIAIRAYEKVGYKHTQSFFTKNLYTGKLTKGVIPTEIDNDGGIKTDGLLHYDTKYGCLVYVYFYKNRFICMDSTFEKIITNKTIDTFSIFQTQAGPISNGNLTEYTNTSPSRFVNWDNCVYDGTLYNNSKIIADNEIISDYNKNSIIDKYDIKSGKYQGSFYLPNYNNERMLQFKVYRNLIIALYSTHILVYKSNQGF